jgi:cell wall-associated NlpC family hydrolase
MFDVSAAVDFALSRAGSPYVYGGTGRMCTPGYRKERMRQYPAQAAAIRSACPVLSGRAAGCSTCGWAGKPCYDCAQLVRAALLRAGAKRVPSGASSLWRMEEMWESKGRIDLSLASSLFCVLFRASAAGDRHPMRHAGISLGDGRAVDARSHARGVLITSLDKYPWTDMAFP